MPIKWPHISSQKRLPAKPMKWKCWFSVLQIYIQGKTSHTTVISKCFYVQYSLIIQSYLLKLIMVFSISQCNELFESLFWLRKWWRCLIAGHETFDVAFYDLRMMVMSTLMGREEKLHCLCPEVLLGCYYVQLQWGTNSTVCYRGGEVQELLSENSPALWLCVVAL